MIVVKDRTVSIYVWQRVVTEAKDGRIQSSACFGDSTVKKLTASLALVAGLVLTTNQSASAGDFLFFHFEDDYSYSQPTYYAPAPQQQTYARQQPVQRQANFLQPIRETAGDTAELYMNLSPGAQIAESMGLLNRRFVLGIFRGY
jgi:hypothetical protein